MPFALPFLPEIISGGASIIGGLLGSNASKSSASTLKDNAGQVVDLTKNAVGDANNKIGSIFGGQTSNLDPYLNAGRQGVTGLTNAFAPGGELTKQFSFDPSQVASSPEYQFALNQGTDAIQKSAAARGGLLSGGTLKGLTQYGQGLASQAYQQAYNNALGTFSTNRNNTLQGLLAQTGIGQTATSQYDQAAQNYGNLYSGNTLTGANIEGNAMTGGANAQAAGQVGSANAWQGTLGGLSNAAQFYQIQQLLKGTSNPYGVGNGIDPNSVAVRGPAAPADYYSGGYGVAG